MEAVFVITAETQKGEIQVWDGVYTSKANAERYIATAIIDPHYWKKETIQVHLLWHKVGAGRTA